MEENVTMVFHGFLNLTANEKLLLVNEINEYFDSNDRETIRQKHEENYEKINSGANAKTCKCCGK